MPEQHPSPFGLLVGTSKFERADLQGPFAQKPSPEDLVFPGAQITSHGGVRNDNDAIEWHELSYQVDQTPWKQRLYLIPHPTGGYLVLKAQARAEQSTTAFQLLDAVVAGYEG